MGKIAQDAEYLKFLEFLKEKNIDTSGANQSQIIDFLTDLFPSVPEDRKCECRGWAPLTRVEVSSSAVSSSSNVSVSTPLLEHLRQKKAGKREKKRSQKPKAASANSKKSKSKSKPPPSK